MDPVYPQSAAQLNKTEASLDAPASPSLPAPTQSGDTMEPSSGSYGCFQVVWNAISTFFQTVFDFLCCYFKTTEESQTPPPSSHHDPIPQGQSGKKVQPLTFTIEQPDLDNVEIDSLTEESTVQAFLDAIAGYEHPHLYYDGDRDLMQCAKDASLKSVGITQDTTFYTQWGVRIRSGFFDELKLTNITKDSTIQEIKDRIERERAIPQPQDRIRLFFQGKELKENDQTLDQIGKVENNVVITVMIAPLRLEVKIQGEETPSQTILVSGLTMEKLKEAIERQYEKPPLSILAGDADLAQLPEGDLLSSKLTMGSQIQISLAD